MDEVTEIYVKVLIDFVRLGVGYEAHRIGKPVRYVSEAIHAEKWYTARRWCSSTAAKKLNPVMSRGAASKLEKSKSLSLVDFAACTMLEHPDELRTMYNELLDIGSVVTCHDVIKVLGRYPLVTVTNCENKKLGRRGGHERYTKNCVEVGMVPKVMPGAPVSSWQRLTEQEWPSEDRN